MTNKTFLILGGYGNTGMCCAKLLLQHTDVHLILAGRSKEKAESAASELNNCFSDTRTKGILLDAANIESLNQSFKEVDFVLVAFNTAKYVKEVATATMTAGIDYLDIQYSQKKADVLKSMAEAIEKSGCCFITDGGFYPGLPAALIRYAGNHFDRLDKANVGSIIKNDWEESSVSQSIILEWIEAFKNFKVMAFNDGQWRGVKFSNRQYLKMNFGYEFGEQTCVPIFLEELRSIPEILPSIKEFGFFVGGFNRIVNTIILPLIMQSPQKWEKQMRSFLLWGLKTFASPPYGTLLKLEARGEKDGKINDLELNLYHKDGYMFTAMPVVACLLQYLDGSIKNPGLNTMANLVDPARLINDMEKWGLKCWRNDLFLLSQSHICA